MNPLQAELLGMHAGDGTLYRTNRSTIVWELRGGLDEQEYYWEFVIPLLQIIFSMTERPKHRSGGGTGSFGIQSCNKNITRYLATFFPVGEKSSRVRVPPEIFEARRNVRCAFLRGIFDTDGCFRLDNNHTARKYYPKIEIGSASKEMRDDLVQLIEGLQIGCHAWTCESKYTSYVLCIPGKKNLARWLLQISSHNPKHLAKFEKWLHLNRF